MHRATEVDRLAIAGGGTGGHLYPGIAVADEAVKRGAEVMFIGVDTGIETRVLPGCGYRLATVRAGKFKGMGIIGKMKTALNIPLGVMQARRIIRDFRPQALLGVGGYASFAGVLGAKLAGVPVVLQEQNAVPGLANRLLGRFAEAVALGFDEARDRFAAAKSCVYTGNPVRTGMSSAGREESMARFGLDPSMKTVLVFGGSAGAVRINNAITEALWLMADRKNDIQFLHQTGRGARDKVAEAYVGRGFGYAALEYIEDMPAAYACADIVVCRSGAMTIAELTMLGKPAILIPYPYAADNHQEKNARALEREGAARVVLDSEASGQRISREIESLIDDPDALAGMAGRSLSLGRPGAASDVYELCEKNSLGVKG